MDFVIDKGDGEIYGFEVKSKLKEPSLTNSIKRFIDEVKPKKVFVLCENLDSKIKYKNCEILFTNHLNIYSIMKSLRPSGKKK